ncbi:MAG: DUF1893 domain-containing protein [Clostridia bacterium]|nr:DUF1893 domain-containing protein [Clostridia bacterium]
MNDIDQAKLYLRKGFRCAVINGNSVFVSEKRGIAPLLDMLDSGMDFCGGVAADKIVGKAAAFVYAKAGISSLYAQVLSKAAIPFLEVFDIKYEYQTLADGIRNRKGDGLCPMESAIKEVFNLDEGLAKLRETVRALQSSGDKTEQ